MPQADRDRTLAFLEAEIASVAARGWFAESGVEVLNEAPLLGPDGAEVRPDRVVLRPDGSAAVILSDGAARAEGIRQKLLDSRSGGMKALAGEILTDAAARAGWEDDMTVLTLALEKRREAV